MLFEEASSAFGETSPIFLLRRRHAAIQVTVKVQYFGCGGF